MIACILIPGFELRAALRERPRLATRAAVLAPLPGEDSVGPITAAAEAAGIVPGMRLGEALATCPSLVLVEHDPAGAERAWERILRRLEGEGFAVEPAAIGCLYVETGGVERLYGGVRPALERALAAVGSSWDARVGVAERKFAALAAASVARPAQVLVVSGEPSDFLEPLPLSLLPLDESRYAELEGLGLRTIGQLASLPGPAVTERLGQDGRRAWSLARGGDNRRVRPRRPPAEIAERLEFLESVGQMLTLQRALDVLVERTLDRPERAERAVRKVALSARLVGGGSWRRSVTLREPSAEKERLRVVLEPKLAELPAPVTSLGLEISELAEWTGQQLELVRAEGTRSSSRLKEGLRQARASTGADAVCTVVEVAPWSRIPERRALLVPRDC
jgi:nucleotidyltransferase/DNA polymerase involved in DNA repair